MQQAVEILTAEALKITRVSQSNWRTSIDKGLYACAPLTVDGRREWDVDSLVCLAWYDALVKAGMKRAMAGRMAAELTKAIARDRGAEHLTSTHGNRIRNAEVCRSAPSRPTRRRPHN